MADDNKINDFEKEIRDMYKERNTRLAFTKPSSRSFGWGMMVVYLLMALASGFVAAAVLLGWFLPLSGYEQPATITTVVTDKETTLVNDINKLSHSTVAIFSEQTVSDKNPLWQQAYLLNKSLGFGLVLSSDGWLVSTNQVITDVNKSYRVMAGNGQFYKTVVALVDPSAPLVYLKIQAQGLQPTAFNRLKDITSGSLVVAQGFLGQGSTGLGAVVRRLAGTGSSGYIKSNTDLVVKAEKVTDVLWLDNALPDKLLGAPIFTLDGKVIGLSAKGVNLDVIYPLDVMDRVMDKMFSQQEIKRPYLGATVVMLDSVLPLVDKPGNWPVAGAWLTGTANQLAVIGKSPAQQSGLKENDVILFVDKDRVAGQSLGYLLQQYDPGTEVTLKVWRAGKEMDIKTTLGEVAGQSSVKK